MTDETLSIDAAAALVDAMDSPVSETEAAPVAEAPEEDETQDTEIAADTGEAEAEPAEAVESGEEEEAEALEPVEAPQWWDAEHKAIFASLTPAQQAAVKANEDKREAVVQKVKTEATEARKAALAEIEAVRVAVTKLDQVVPDKLAEFEAKYKDIDWNAIPQWAEQNPEAANAFLAKYNAERVAIEKLTTAQAEATKLAQQSFAREQAARLQEIAPDLVKNPENLKALGEYAVKNGVKSEDLNFADAEHLVILNKARLYDDMMAKAAATPQASATPPKQARPVRVPPQGQAAPSSTSQQRETDALRNRFAQTKSVDDAAALISKLGFG